jgi:glycosyltransferase involved in cell wall biosynthesis
MRVALLHDWILGISGTERVLKALHELFPDAPIFTLLAREEFTKSFLPHAHIETSPLQKIFRKGVPHSLLGPLLPTATESFDLSDFDLVISSAFAYTKGVITKPRTLHINYCHSPTRQLWDWHIEYKQEARRTPRFVNALSQHIGRLWDHSASRRVDYYIANSATVQQRIAKYYQRDSQIIYPPVEMPKNIHKDKKTTHGEYFLIVSRLFPHKNIELAIHAFNKMGWPLVIIGDGPQKNYLQSIAENTIHFLGHQSDGVIQKYYQHCKAFVMPQEEDFGITAIEAMSYGKPVLALKRGGAREYIQEGMNGEFFEFPIEEVLAYGLKRIYDRIQNYDPDCIRAYAENFSKERFQQQITHFIQEKSRAS